MCSLPFSKMGLWGIAGIFTGVLLLNPAGAQSGPENPVVGEIISNDVYVRSGDSLNHYTVCKLDAGDQVTIVGERGEWYEILPPPGTFSLISGDYVDRSESAGVVNGDNVRVRAGSLLNDNKYTVQSMLQKGAAVTVLGSNPDGFLRIVPPPGATLWINKQFVAHAGSRVASTPGSAAPTVPSGVNESKETAAPASASAATTPAPRADEEASEGEKSGVAAAPSIPSDSPLAGVPASEPVRRLHALETSLRLELTRQPFDRNFKPLVTGYQAIAAQQEDDVARRYALGRLTQLSELTDLTHRASQSRGLDEESARQREQFLQKRASIPAPLAPDPAALDVQGELRESALYPAGTLPRRYRLVDPSGDRVRTVAYVEVPSSSAIRAEDFLGRMVGVRASGQRPHEGGIDPVPVYMARELVALGQAPAPASSLAPAVPSVSRTPSMANPPETGKTSEGTSNVIMRDVR